MIRDVYVIMKLLCIFALGWLDVDICGLYG